jgi:hypothetical protein
MTNNIPNQPPNRLDQIEAILLQVVTQQQATATALTQVTQRLNQIAQNQQASDNRITELANKVDDFIGTANTVLGRSAILDGIVIELRETVVRLDANAERIQANFEENQRSNNAALERLEAILMKLIGNNGHAH